MDFPLLSAASFAIGAVYFLAGVVDAICGGGGLLTIPVLMAIGVPTHYIAGTNQCAIVPGTFVSTSKFVRSGNISLKSAIAAGLASIPGSWLGAQLNILLPERYLQIIMIALLPVIAVIMLLKKDFGAEDRSNTISSTHTWILGAVVGLVLGAYQGFYGPGGGTFYTLAFTVLLRLNLVKASGNTKVAALLASISSTVTYALSGFILWKIVLIAVLLNTAGSWVGASLALKKGARLIRPLMFVMLAVLLVYVIYQLHG